MRANKKLTLAIFISLTFLVFIKLAWLSIARYQAYNVRAFDIGIMSQAIWSATQGQPLLFTIEGMPLSRLARHVELIYFLFAPFYAMWPNPQTLLILQALLYVVGAFPLYNLAQRRINSARLGVVITATYLFYPVAQTAVLYDFHGDTLAMPLFLFVIEALDRKAWRSYTFWLILTLSCKFYVAALVVGLGSILWLRGEQRAGLMTAISGVLWGSIAFWLIRPFFAPPEAALVQATSASYIAHYFGDVQVIMDSLDLRLLNILVVYLPALIIGWRSPIWLLVASILTLPVFLSTGPGRPYDYRLHHYALPVPFFMAAIVYGAEKLRAQRLAAPNKTRTRLPWFMPLIYTLFASLFMNSLLVDTPLNLQFYRPTIGSGKGLEVSAYLSTSRDRFKDEWLVQHVPPTSAVAADTILAPHLTNRAQLYLAGPSAIPLPKTLSQLLPAVDYVVIDSLFDLVIGNSDTIILGGISYSHHPLTTLMNQADLTLQKTGDGLLLFGRSPGGLKQNVSTQTITITPPLQATFDDMIGLTQAAITPLNSHRYRLETSWLPFPSLTSETTSETSLIAVSHLAGVPHSRFVHLPTWILHPPSNWQPNEIVHERFDLDIPTELPPGTYPILVGWYQADTIYTPLTDEKTRIGDLVQIGQIEIP